MEGQREIERVARESYGRLVAFLAADTHDLQEAEDLLADSVAAALQRWKRDGIPKSPEAWLLSVARRKHVDLIRRRGIQSEVIEKLSIDPTDTRQSVNPDRRLQLLFLCAHPDIEPKTQTPLMLNVIFGFSARDISGPFFLSPSAMSQRLVRAKKKIKDLKLKWEMPCPAQFPSRLGAVLDSIYCAFGLGWDDIAGAESSGTAMSDEAIWLTRFLLKTLPHEPEVMGLMALMLYSHARRAARIGAGGEFVPLNEQDMDLWNIPMMDEADSFLAKAGAYQRPGPYQLEACIQAAHAERRLTGHPNWEAILKFYDSINQSAPTMGSRVSQAGAYLAAGRTAKAKTTFDQLCPDQYKAYQPYWVLKANLEQLENHSEAAMKAASIAIGLTESAPIKKYLKAKFL